MVEARKPNSREVAKSVREQVLARTSRGIPVTPKDLEKMYQQAGGNPHSAQSFRNQVHSRGFYKLTGVDISWKQIAGRTIYFDVKNPPSDEAIGKIIHGF